MKKIRELLSREQGASLVSVVITLVIIQALSLTLMIAVANINKGSNISNKLVTSSEIANSVFEVIELEFAKEVKEMKTYNEEVDYAKLAAENIFKSNNPNNITKEVYSLGFRDGTNAGYESYAAISEDDDDIFKNERYKINVGYIVEGSSEIISLDNTNPIRLKKNEDILPTSESYIQFFVQITYGDFTENGTKDFVTFNRLVVVD